MSRPKLIIAALAALALVIFFVVPTGIKSVVRYAALQELKVFGIQDISINNVSLSWDHLTIQDIRAKTARGYQPKGREDYLVIDQVEGKFTPLHLLTRGFDELFIRGVSLWIEPENGYFTSFNALGHESRGGQKAPNITIEKSEIIIANGEDLLHIPVNATIHSEPGKPKIVKAQWSLTGGSSADGTLSFESNDQGFFDLSLEGQKILLNTTNISINADDLQLTAKGTEGSDIYDLALNLTVNDVNIDKVNTFKKPVLLEATAKGPLTELNISTSLKRKGGKSAKGKPFIEVSGTAELFQAVAKTKWDVDMPKVQDILDLGKLLALSKYFPQSLTGQIKIDGTIDWEGEWTQPLVDATVGLQDVDTTYNDFHGTGISGSVKVTGLNPFVTKNHQILSAKSIHFKEFHMNEAKFEFSASALGGFSVNSLSGNIFDGTLTLHGFHKSVKDPAVPLTFDTNFKDIQLNDVLKIADIKGLSGTGKITGSASFKMNDQVELTRAQFRSSSDKGSIVYIPESSAPAEDKSKPQSNLGGADLALEVLKDLQFTVLDVTVAPSPRASTQKSQELQASVKLLGSNSKVLNGYPFEFNINTTGKLGDLVLNTLNNMKPPKDLQELGATIKKSQGATAK